jgi:hypothetical protein
LSMMMRCQARLPCKFSQAFRTILKKGSACDSSCA